MANVHFDPRLSTDPLDKDVLLSVTFIGSQTAVYGEPRQMQLKAGINRNIPDQDWEAALELDHIRDLVRSGALRVVDSAREEEKVIKSMTAIDTLEHLTLEESLQLISECHEPEQLEQWHGSAQRVKVRNACVRRRNELTQGNG